jgi:hypothetical protein
VKKTTFLYLEALIHFDGSQREEGQGSQEALYTARDNGLLPKERKAAPRNAGKDRKIAFCRILIS